MLEKIRDPGSLQGMTENEIHTLCDEIREFLLKHVSRTGGHLASNLGVVELTVALHRVFDTRKEKLFFDVGHQSYVHKILTGRADRFDTLRCYQGLSGFPRPQESEYDAFPAGHASTSVSLALGQARALRIRGEETCTVALIGDGAMTGGTAYEALNDLGVSGERVIVVLNDNGMAISPNVGAVAKHLSNLRMKPGYRRLKAWYRGIVKKHPNFRRFYRLTHGIKQALKEAVLHCSMFENMGLEYLGPIDGSSEGDVEEALWLAKSLKVPTVVHVITKKGRGYLPAEQEPETYHGISSFDLREGVSLSKPSFSEAFGDYITEFASDDGRICAVTAAMEPSTGLHKFAQTFQDRFFDVGIAEEHAISMTAGLANGGMIPVAAIYSTFLQRAYDMIQQDICLPGTHCVLAVDRCGIVGADGETHQGIWDVGFLSQMPGLEIWCPACYGELRGMLRHCLFSAEGPCAIRYPRGEEGEWKNENCDPLLEILPGDFYLVTAGILINEVLEAARLLRAEGLQAGVIKISRIKPFPTESIEKLLVDKRWYLLEENCRRGGIGENMKASLSGKCGDGVLMNTGDGFVPQGTRRQLLESLGLDAAGITRRVKEYENGR